MRKIRTSLYFAAACVALIPAGAWAQNSTTYTGNGNGSFAGPIGQGTLTFSTDGTTLNGTIHLGGNNAFNDEFVIYIDAKAGGFANTGSLTDTGGGTGNNGDYLREATSGYNGNVRSTVNFASGFGADYAIALSPAKAKFGSFYTLNNNGTLLYGSDGSNGNANLSPTYSNNGTNSDGTFTFSIPLSLIGSPTSFNFETTYLNGPDVYRSNEAIGNGIADHDNPTNTGSLGQDAADISSFSTFSTVPEPGTWLAGGLMLAVAGWTVCRFRRSGVC